jgi:hypothetical protein
MPLASHSDALVWFLRLPLLSNCAGDGVLRIRDTETRKIRWEIPVASGERVIQILEDGKSLVVIHLPVLSATGPRRFKNKRQTRGGRLEYRAPSINGF